jgi:hypothetical protein
MSNIDLVKLFVNNEPMQRAVKTVIEETFRAKKPNEDIHTKAGRFIALELLNEAWLELDRLKARKEEEPTIRSQVGL